MKDDKKIQEMQIIEQTLQNILLQKQAFNMELSETETSLKELNSSDDEVFRIVGQIMIKIKKDSAIKEMNDKKRIIEMRLNSLDKQESSFTDQLQKIREEILGN